MRQRIEDDIVVVSSMATLAPPEVILSPSKHQETGQNKLDDTGGSRQLRQIPKGGTIHLSLTNQLYCHYRHRSTRSADFFVRGRKAYHIRVLDADH
jgi:hypothetical protein